MVETRHAEASINQCQRERVSGVALGVVIGVNRTIIMAVGRTIVLMQASLQVTVRSTGHLLAKLIYLECDRVLSVVFAEHELAGWPDVT